MFQREVGTLLHINGSGSTLISRKNMPCKTSACEYRTCARFVGQAHDSSRTSGSSGRMENGKRDPEIGKGNGRCTCRSTCICASPMSMPWLFLSPRSRRSRLIKSSRLVRPEQKLTADHPARLLGPLMNIFYIGDPIAVPERPIGLLVQDSVSSLPQPGPQSQGRRLGYGILRDEVIRMFYE